MHIKQEILKWYIGNNNQLESIKFWVHITYSKCAQNNIGQTKNSDRDKLYYYHEVLKASER